MAGEKQKSNFHPYFLVGSITNVAQPRRDGEPREKPPLKCRRVSKRLGGNRAARGKERCVITPHTWLAVRANQITPIATDLNSSIHTVGSDKEPEPFFLKVVPHKCQWSSYLGGEMQILQFIKFIHLKPAIPFLSLPVWTWLYLFIFASGNMSNVCYDLASQRRQIRWDKDVVLVNSTRIERLWQSSIMGRRKT